MNMKNNRHITPIKHKNSIEYGQSLIEYALIIVMVSLVAVGSLTLMGTSIKEVYNLMLCEIQNKDDCQTQVYLEEDFGDGSEDGNEENSENESEYDFSDWETGLWRKKNKEWWVEDGKLVSEKDASILFDQFVDGAYSVAINGVELLNDSDRKQGLSLHFNSSYEDKNFSGYALKIMSEKKGDYIYFQEYSRGKPVKPYLTEKIKLPPDFNWDSPVDIQVDVQGNTFTGYVNGQSVIQTQDNTYSNGQVGIASGNNSEYSVSEIQVQSIEDLGGD